MSTSDGEKPEQRRVELVVPDIRTDNECTRILQKIANKLVSLRAELGRLPKKQGSNDAVRIDTLTKEIVGCGKSATQLHEKVAQESNWPSASRKELDKLNGDANDIGRRIRQMKQGF